MTKHFFVLPILQSLTVAAALAAPGTTQAARELSTPTGYLWYHGAPATTISDAIANGYRPIDIEVEGTSPLRFTTTLVRNTGAYQSGFWWYHGLTTGQLATLLQNNQGRLIDLEVYQDGGATRIACIMVPNTGANQKGWWYAIGATASEVGSYLSVNNARPVDLESYTVNGTTRYAVVMIQNTGADYRSYAWYYNVPAATIQTSIDGGRRVYDLERRSNGNFDAILVTESQQPPWAWWYGLTAADVGDKLDNWGHRPIDLEPYTVNGQLRFAMATVNNSNDLTTSVGYQMRAITDGTVGCLLQEINGGDLAALNAGRQFEPASTMKTLHHVHAFRQVLLGHAAMLQPITVYTGLNGTCPNDTEPVTETMTVVLRKMMEQSDNCRTQAIAVKFGQSAINATAQALGMSSTSLNHRLGCGLSAVLDPNRITLHDLARLHTEVSNGYVGPWRDVFYEHMANSLSWSGLSTVIDEEAAAAGVSQAAKTSFKALVSLAQKGGSYTLSATEHRTRFGWIRIPFLVGNQLQPREYAVGAFVNDATDGTDASNACKVAIAELLRPVISQALRDWNVTAVAAPFGTGCPARRPLTQDSVGLPRIGLPVHYEVLHATPSAPAIMSVGVSDRYWGRMALPASLAFVGAPDCFVYNDVIVTNNLIADGAGVAVATIQIPNDYALLGGQYFTQWFSFGSTLRSSNGMRNVIGD